MLLFVVPSPALLQQPVVCHVADPVDCGYCDLLEVLPVLGFLLINELVAMMMVLRCCLLYHHPTYNAVTGPLTANAGQGFGFGF